MPPHRLSLGPVLVRTDGAPIIADCQAIARNVAAVVAIYSGSGPRSTSLHESHEIAPDCVKAEFGGGSGRHADEEEESDMLNLNFLWKDDGSGGGGCPALYRTDGGYVVQGKMIDDATRGTLRQLADDEDAVFVPANVLDKLAEAQLGMRP